jgi:hypothetical protein
MRGHVSSCRCLALLGRVVACSSLPLVESIRVVVASAPPCSWSLRSVALCAGGAPSLLALSSRALGPRALSSGRVGVLWARRIWGSVSRGVALGVVGLISRRRAVSFFECWAQGVSSCPSGAAFVSTGSTGSGVGGVRRRLVSVSCGSLRSDPSRALGPQGS